MLDKEPRLGLTYDDVVLIPAKSQVLPSEVDMRTRLTRHIKINIPIISSAMDTVTESRLAIAIAREGGMGIIHRVLSPSDQATEVDRVKKSESGMILDPITISPNQTIRDARALMAKYRISGIPVTKGKKLVGILTNRDLRFETRMELKVSQVMKRDKLITAAEGTSLEKAREVLHEHRIEKLPVVNKNFELKGLITIKDIEKRILYPNACKDKHGRLCVGAAVGVGPDTADRVARLKKVGVDVIVVDTAHGHSKNVIDTVQGVKKRFNIEVIAGNVGTADGAKALIDAGADAVKVGIGPGSICTTRVVTGVGMPQITAIMEAVRACEAQGVPVIADGGIRQSGDIAKAIAAGASCVMLGSMFAGLDESPGEVVLHRGRRFKSYRGMGSEGAMIDGSADRYGQGSISDSRKFVPEGVEGRVPYRGSLADFTYQIVGGVRAAMGYCGCQTLAQLRKEARFVKISTASLMESHPHSIQITKESPNYSANYSAGSFGGLD